MEKTRDLPMRRLLALPVLLTLLTASACASARRTGNAAPASADEQAVLAVVDQLFDGMRARDTASMSAVFASEARFYGIGRDGQVTVTLPADFIAGIGRAPEGVLLDEVLHDPEVRVDGPLATVWTYYDFVAGGNFSHCGFDAMQLLKVQGEWKIVALADTRRREGCRAS